LNQAVLHFDRAADCIDYAAKLDDRAVAGELDDASVVGGDCRVDEIAAKAAEARKRPVLIGACKPRVADDMAMSDVFFARSPGLVVADHEQPVPIFQQLA